MPKSFPVRRAYPLLISTLQHKVEIENEGFIAIEFCSYAPLSCTFEEYCTCKKYKNEGDDTM